ncbi:tetratricopeptide repeat protein [candidate division TA06 bacterium]|uniref:Tetratricopeptide repeat protein n=1 Tax=candidate division TA06 bacterium TaxID=2250710 RepID=A0A523UWG7_UNCT6|nr:MAG: tetratricopeptide repeat protein [candidate division TA06 bacterium]
MVLEGRYRVLHRLGSGAVGEVYRVLDLSERKELALKLASPHLTKEEKLAFQREFHTLSNLSHPNIVRVHDYGVTSEGRQYFTMELVDGENFDSGFKDDVGLIVSATCEVLRALHFLHSKGLVHCDLKPQNILVCKNSESPGIKLLDFGLAGAADILSSNGVSGTFAYMAPEMARWGKADRRADIYSLGVVVYEELTGKTAFKGEDPITIIRSHMETKLEPVSKTREGIPIELERVISKMVEKEPRRRYQSAAEAIRDLSKLLPDLSCETLPISLGRQLLTSALVGRDAHISRLVSMLEKARKQHPSCCLIVGERGSGKSRLVQELKSQAQLKGALTFTGRCSKASTAPLLPIKSIADQATMRGYQLDTEIEETELTTELDEKTDSSMILARIFDSIALVSRKENRPIVLVIEDINFADEMTLRVVPFIARSLKDESVLLIVTSEPEQPENPSEHHLSREAPFVTTELGPLDKVQTTEMVGQMLGTERPPHQLSDWVYEHAGGNPLLIEESLSGAVSGKAVTNEDGQWLVDTDRLQKVKATQSVTGIVDSWLIRLDEKELELLRKASILGDTFDVDLLQKLAEVRPEELFILLNTLENENILVPSPENSTKLIFSHKWVRDIIYSAIEKERRAGLHERAVRILESDYPDKEEVTDTLAYHASSANLVDESVKYCTLAAKKALKVQALKTALHYYQWALDILPQGSNHQRPVILEAVGDLYRTLGQYDEALNAYNQIISFRSASPRISLKIGQAHIRKGNKEEALAIFKSAIKAIPEDKNTDRVTVLSELALTYLAFDEYDKAEESAHQALRVAEEIEDKRGLSRVYHVLGLIKSSRENFEKAIECNLKSLRMKEELNDAKGMASSHNNLGILYWNKRMYDKAIESYAQSLTIMEKVGDIAGVARAHNNIGLVEMQKGSWDDAAAHLRESLNVFERLNDRSVLGQLYMNMGAVADRQGRWQEALSFVEKGSSMFEQVGQQSNLATCLRDAGTLHLRLGNMEEAESRLKRALTLTERLGDPLAQASVLLDLGYFHREAFHWKKALNCLKRSLEISEARGATERLSIIKSLLAEVYTAKGDLENARKSGEEALQLSVEVDDPAQIANTHLALAQLAVAEGDELVADDQFNRAIQGLSGLGKRYDLGRALLEAGKWKISLWRKSRKNDEFSAACSYLKDAEGIFRDLNAKRDLEHVHEASVDLVEKLSSESLAPSTREDQLKTIYEVSEIINSILNLDELLNRVIDLVIHLLEAERGVLMLVDETTGELKVAAGREIDSTTIEDASQISTSVLNRVANRRKPVMSGNALVDSRFSRSKSVLNHRIKSLLCVPLMIRDRVTGTIYVDSRISPHLFGKEDELFLESLANLIAVAIENSKHHRELHAERDYLRLEVKRKYHFRNLIGATEQMKNLYDLIERVAKSESNILILGETGTGKELVARAIHYSSERANKNFVTVVVSALPEPLLESELFGHKKGSFTGAVSDEKGLFENADGGTIFLDEIGDAPLAVQSKLLRVIEEGETRRVGDTEQRKVDVRVICATNRRLPEEVNKGRFREDLFYRLNVISISIPPLRERKKDIPLLTEHFLKVYRDRTGKRLEGISKEAMSCLLDYDWPGNVRELENCIERAVVMTKSDRIDTEDLYPLFGRETTGLQLKELKHDTEKKRILEALVRTRGNVTRAAKELGIHRQQLQRLMKKHSVAREEFRRASPLA